MSAGLLLLLHSALLVSALQTQTQTQTATSAPTSGTTKLATQTQTTMTPGVAATGVATTVTTPTLYKGRSPTWAENILNAVGAVLNNANNQTGATNSSVAIGNFMSRLPGILRGVGGVDIRGNDVGTILASLFGNSR